MQLARPEALERGADLGKTKNRRNQCILWVSVSEFRGEYASCDEKYQTPKKRWKIFQKCYRNDKILIDDFQYLEFERKRSTHSLHPIHSWNCSSLTAATWVWSGCPCNRWNWTEWRIKIAFQQKTAKIALESENWMIGIIMAFFVCFLFFFRDSDYLAGQTIMAAYFYLIIYSENSKKYQILWHWQDLEIWTSHFVPGYRRVARFR